MKNPKKMDITEEKTMLHTIVAQKHFAAEEPSLF
jgi:hypothetical protein